MLYSHPLYNKDNLLVKISLLNNSFSELLLETSLKETLFLFFFVVVVFGLLGFEHITEWHISMNIFTGSCNVYSRPR